ncbi:MAG TPA: FKBP-type peptidyl-prolyl cis-trans isomerase [Sphingomicrobium sp.]|nr:FKBP-type peptidyl-prolyl cis-trans isomerase [Sphingomicrobium sp.]
MSVAEAAHRPTNRGRAVKLWLGFLIVIAAAVGLAWIGAGSLRPQLSSTGLEFRVVKNGSGEPITAADAALLDYVGTLDDGTVFDTSRNHGGPQPFTMDQVFPGFAEAMAQMREGGEYRFTMPPRLAFGDRPPPPGFPKDSNLTFEVQVRKIVRGGAAMMQQMQQQQQRQQQ